jgi:hypothetical protein
LEARVLAHEADGADAVALLEQSHPGGTVLYIVTIAVVVHERRRAPRRFTFARVETDKARALELYERACGEFVGGLESEDTRGF